MFKAFIVFAVICAVAIVTATVSEEGTKHTAALIAVLVSAAGIVATAGRMFYQDFRSEK